MKNATGISRWTSAGRNHAVHILNDEGSLVLCKKQFFSHNTSALDIEKVTCARCLAIFKKLNIADVNGWLDFESNKELFNEEAKKNCLCKFEDGTIIRYYDEHPMEIMTHFKLD